MKIKLISFLLFISITLFTLTGCQGKAENTAATTNGKSENTEATTNGKVDAGMETRLLEEFDALINTQNVNLKDVFTFLESNISYIAKLNASQMLLKVETLQEELIRDFEKKFYPQEVIKIFQEADLAGKDVNDPSSFTDSQISALVQETLDGGYKIEQAEGMYYPVINYTSYLPFTDYVSDDLKEYFTIMNIESSQVFAKDAALMITWDEVISRALQSQEFLLNFPDSEKFTAIEELYQRYLNITLLGLNNTPLFDYESGMMNNEAKAAYEAAVVQKNDREYLTILEDFMKVVKENGYKLTDEVDQFRKRFVAQ
jgi:hypothetical protein